MPNAKVLLVDADAKSQRVLEVSLRKAGFEVSTARNVEEAWEAALVHGPDIVVTESTFVSGNGFELCRRLRDDPRTAGSAVVFLAQDGSPEAKIRAISAGADEYLTKPVFVKEIIGRIGGMAERRRQDPAARERAGNFRGTLAGMGLVDIFQVVESGKKSGVLRLTSDAKRSGGLLGGPGEAEIWFRDGAAIDAVAGRLRGEAAIYRLFLWDDGDFELSRETPARDDVVRKPLQAVLLEGMRRVDEWTRLAPRVPPLHFRLDVDYRVLGGRVGSLPAEAEALVRLFDGKRALLEALDDAPVDELSALGIVARLLHDKILIDTTKGRPSMSGAPSTLAAWLAEPALAALDAGSSAQAGADLLANIPVELGAAMYPSAQSASQILSPSELPRLNLTARPEPLPEPAPGSAILARSIVPSSASAPARPALQIPPATSETGLVVRRVGSTVGTAPADLHISVPPPPPPSPMPSGRELPMLVRPAGSGVPTPVQTFGSLPPPVAPAVIPPAFPTGVARVPTPQAPEPAVVPPGAEGEDAASQRPRRGPRGSSYRGVRRSGSFVRQGPPSPEGEAMDEATVADTSPPAPAASPPPPPPASMVPPAPAAVPAAPPSHRPLDEDFAALRGEDSPQRPGAIQAILALAVAALIVGFGMFLLNEKKQPRVPAQLPVATKTATKAHAAWPVAPVKNATITSLPAVITTASVAKAPPPPPAVVPPPVPTATPTPVPAAADPAALQAELDKGLAALRRERAKDAETAYNAVLALDPKNAAANAGLAHTQFLRGRDGAAAKSAYAALALDPKNGHAQLVLGLVASSAGNTAEANDRFRRFLALDPKSPFAPEVRKLVQAQP